MSILLTIFAYQYRQFIKCVGDGNDEDADGSIDRNDKDYEANLLVIIQAMFYR